MEHTIRISRTFWYDEPNVGRKTLKQSDLLASSQPIVVLGEPGMGKTELLLWLKQQPGFAYCTARQLNNARPPKKVLGNAKVLVVDALDELSVRTEGDAVDVVLQKLGDAGYPQFVLACRVADWRNATATAAIAEQYQDVPPLVLHLEPLADVEVHQLLVAELDGDVSRAQAAIEHFEKLGLGGLLSNPQTLELVARVAKSGQLPETKALLFDSAVDLLRKEINEAKFALQPDQVSALDAAGAAFAALILTGSEALVIDSANADDGELLAVEVATLPGASELCAVMGSRLFGMFGGAQRFKYWHRRIGEYLGARWLAHQASSAMRRRRILRLFHGYGLVPSPLRGLHAWLAHHSPSLAPNVIAADVAAFIDYGEADSLSPTQSKRLLAALKDLAKRNPQFYIDGTTTARSLVRIELLEDVRAVLKDRAGAFSLRYLLLTNIRGSAIAEPLRVELRTLMLDDGIDGDLRRLAFEALACLGGEDWPVNLDQLQRGSSDASGTQLLIEIINYIGVETLGARAVIDWVARESQEEERVVGLLDKLGAGVSDSSLDAVLDEFALLIGPFDAPQPNRPAVNGMLADFAGLLISRRLNLGQIDVPRLWRWLQAAHLRHAYDKCADHKLQALPEVRRAVQKWVLIEEAGDISPRQRHCRLERTCAALKPNEDDLLALMISLDAAQRSDERWRRLLLVAEHSATEGVRLRAAAKAFAAHRPDLLDWIDRLGVERFSRSQVKRARATFRLKARLQLQYLEVRNQYRQHLEALKSGKFNLVHHPAVVFLGLASNVPRTGSPFERLSTWLGQDIAQVAIHGFEAYLQSDAPPTADQVGQSNAESKRWESSSIVLAAVLARLEDGRKFDGVSDDRLKAAFWIAQAFQNDSIGSNLKPALLEELRSRDLVEAAVRCWVDPLLNVRHSHVEGLHHVLWRWLSESSASSLSLEWLSRFPDLPGNVESEIIDRLLSLERLDEVRSFIAIRLNQALTEERQDDWNAIAILIDFDAHRERLCNLGAELKGVIWRVRQRQQTDRTFGPQISLNVAQLTFLVEKFRTIYPFVPRPDSTTTGNQNSWDAARLIESFASRLAQDTSVEAIYALSAIAEAEPDGYTPRFLGLLAEQRRKLAEQQYQPISLSDLAAIANSRPPATVLDLQSTMLELLEEVQQRIRGDNVDSRRNFYTSDGAPLGEERCRDQLLLMLGVRPESIDLDPEIHSANDKRADIGATLNGMRLPIEIKGQWHRDLWTAADGQLDRLYATDHAADRRGIYIILWFGHDVPCEKRPKASESYPRPLSAESLQRDIVSTSKAAREGRIAVVVLNLEP